MKYVKIYATFSDLFGRKFDKQELISFIKSLPLGGLLNILSQITSLPLNDNRIREHFISFIESIDENNHVAIRDRLQNRMLYSHQGLLTVWKWLLAYGDKNKLGSGVEIRRGINILIYLCLIVSDYLYESDGNPVNIEYEMLRNAAFNSQQDMYSSIGRAAYVYIELAQNKLLFNEKEYVDFNTEFNKHYGCTLEEYLAAVCALFALFMNKDYEIRPVWSKNLEEVFSKTALSKDIIKPLLVEFDDASEWARQTLDSPWNFLLFKDKPLLLIDKKIFLPIMVKFVQEQVFIGLFHKIAYCYQDNRFLRFIGRPFEIYLRLLMQEAVKQSPIPYEVVPEFRYGKGGGKRSPEIMLKLGDNLLVVEGKARRMKLSSLVDGDPTSVDKDMSKMVIEPIRQMHSRLLELFQLPGIPINLSNVKNIYLMGVTLENFPTLLPFENKIQQTINQYFELPIDAYFHVDIEEFELLCYLISRKNGRPIFRILENKAKLYPNITFKNFLHISSLPMRRPDFINCKSQQLLNKILRIIFPDTNV
ncbi:MULTISPECIES: hypothetical protein [unclassified Neomoorella]|uniref:hypothetical protein n=1 Tax=unclassified Neomoorella TaxID=2676739 RepID=UPI001142FF53|nr:MULTISPECIES: hypothetical protein [unclassified Moorella (in: firmicutes)]